jgi:hypothetical protein
MSFFSQLMALPHATAYARPIGIPAAKLAPVASPKKPAVAVAAVAAAPLKMATARPTKDERKKQEREEDKARVSDFLGEARSVKEVRDFLRSRVEMLST